MLNPLSFIGRFFKGSNQAELSKLSKVLEKVNSFEDVLSSASDASFIVKTQEFKKKIESGISLEDILPEAFACVREASKRSRGERHFDVQILGGIVLHQGKIAEMKTGEGKTITIALAAYLNALKGNGVHVVTVNDYLAKRDCEEMSKIYNFLGLSAGYISNEQEDEIRKVNYDKDITYGTNSEFGFDYLKDNMKLTLDSLVQRGHAYAIVDEIDSCLIDEARTPLVISGKADDTSNQYKSIDRLVKKLDTTEYEVDEKEKNISLTDKGIDNVEKILNNIGILKNNNFYDPENLNLVHHVNQALKANYLFTNNKDYVNVEGKIKIVDELTGRILEGRRYSDGLHQAIEAKENVEIQIENQTLASITYQNYFKLYKKISGCTGTALTESQEFFEIYNLSVVVIPTNKNMIRKDWNDQIFRTEKEKQFAIVKKVKECSKKGQPLLIFTSSVDKSEVYSKLFSQNGIKHTVLNAKNHEKEAEIIANAGKLNSVIITTSISGRGVDIKLGGSSVDHKKNDYESDKKIIKNLGGLFVIGTERMESRRVDNQARGRAGRQGDEGSSIFYVSLDDDLMRIFGSESINKVLEKLGLKDGESIDHPWINKALERAQQKVEARNFDIRKTLLKFDDVLNDQRHVIFSQRKEVLEKKVIFEFIDKFLDDEINDILLLKNKSPKIVEDKSFQSKFRILLGDKLDNFKEEISKNDDEIRDKIKKNFSEKRTLRTQFLGDEGSIELEKKIFLQIIDLNWKNHIQYLEQLRQVIGLRSYGQRDPLVEYKKEAFNSFETLLNKISQDLVYLLLNIKMVEKQNQNTSKNNLPPLRKPQGKKIGRNEICSCGSGKKYKHCCGIV